MTIDEARHYFTSCRDRGEPATVLYRPRCDHTERGVITRVSGDWVFVRYGSQLGAQATDAADLELPTGGTDG